jgi:GcrA cell cycle regulator
MSNEDWSNAQIESLTWCVNSAVSFSAIAPIVGKSRNSCIGKARRLGLVCKNSPGGTKKLIEPVTMPSDTAGVSLMELTNDTCRWPIGDVGAADFHFCGHPPKKDAPYRDSHCAVAYQKPGRLEKMKFVRRTWNRAA